MTRARRCSAPPTPCSRERGDGFEISASVGSVLLPEETADSSEALRLADQRMYADKNSSRRSGTAQEVARTLLSALAAAGSASHRSPCRRRAPGDRHRPSARAARRSGRADRPRRRAARRRQGRDPRDDPVQARSTDRAGMGPHAPAHDRRPANPATPPPHSGTLRRWSGARTSAGTARAIPTGCPAPRSRLALGSSPFATPTTR